MVPWIVSVGSNIAYIDNSFLVRGTINHRGTCNSCEYGKATIDYSSNLEKHGLLTLGELS